MKEEIINELVQEMNKVMIYNTLDEKGKIVKTIRCDVVCAILTVILDKYIKE